MSSDTTPGDGQGELTSMTVDWEGPRQDLTEENMHAILSFLPDLEAGRPRQTAFVETLYRHHWMYAFVWMDQSWQERMLSITNDPEQMAEADLETLRRMLITYVRADRFCEGALASAFQDGYILAILQRLSELVEASSGQEGTGEAQFATKTPPAPAAILPSERHPASREAR